MTVHRPQFNNVSVIIPAHNERHYLPGLLDSLKELIQPGGAEVIIIDNGSTDGSAEIIRQYPCRYLHIPRKVAPSTARNFGVAASQGSVLVFLDADVLVTSRWIAELAKALPVLHSQPLVLTGDQYHISSKPSWIERHWFEPLRAQPKSYLNGGNIITTREAFDLARGFDERLETGEDVDFCARAVAAKCELIFNTNFVILHEGFPKTVQRFVKRERWHGTGDFVKVRNLLRSKIALLTVAFLVLHILAIVGLTHVALGNGAALLAISIGGIALVCLISSLYRFRDHGLTQLFAGTAISYLYFFGRSLSLLQVLKRRLTHSGT